MNNNELIAGIIPALHDEARRLLPRRFQGRIRPSDLAQSTAQIMLKSNLSRIECVLSWAKGIIRKLIIKDISVYGRRNRTGSEILVYPSMLLSLDDKFISLDGNRFKANDSIDEMMSAAKLDLLQKSIVQKYFVEKKTMRAIAEILEIPLSTLYSRYSDALEKIRKACDARIQPFSQ